MTRRAAESEKRTHAYNGDHTLERGGGVDLMVGCAQRTRRHVMLYTLHAACTIACACVQAGTGSLTYARACIMKCKQQKLDMTGPGPVALTTLAPDHETKRVFVLGGGLKMQLHYVHYNTYVHLSFICPLISSSVN